MISDIARVLLNVKLKNGGDILMSFKGSFEACIFVIGVFNVIDIDIQGSSRLHCKRILVAMHLNSGISFSMHVCHSDCIQLQLLNGSNTLNK